MHHLTAFKRQLHIRHGFIILFVAIVVAAHGAFIVATTLLDQLAVRHGTHLSDITVDIPLLFGLTLLYVSGLLRRRKQTAWVVAVLIYGALLVLGLLQLASHHGVRAGSDLEIIRAVLLPLGILLLLTLTRSNFVVRSDLQGFRLALRTSLLLLLVAFIYGVAGFMLLDKSDFHQEVPPTAAVHYTIDQFDLTTNHPLQPHTRRAHLFVDSLSVVSIVAVAYSVIALFQPLRARLSDQTAARSHMAELLRTQRAHSEEFFKLWPHDKQYFFDRSGQSGLALHVQNGVALCMGDPAGKQARFKQLLAEFREVCYGNDWLPAFIHTEDKHRKLYESMDFSLQKIGQEAVIDLAAFQQSVATGKYFRHIRNKFTKQDYTVELLLPPHHEAVVQRLRSISDDWLRQPGRTERRFVMGYFRADYLQLCPIMVVRDAAGTIQAFLNQVPADFDQHEATYDMLRQSSTAAGNITDFLLMGFMDTLAKDGYERLNLGLCPLVGLSDEDASSQGLIGSVLGFVYANGDRFYSFSGLERFKAKYQPEWRDRYIAYQGGVRGFSRTTNALMRVMRVKPAKH